MATHEHREHDYSRSNDPLNDLVMAWILALVVLAAMRGKNLKDPVNRDVVQDVIWDYTDFGGLTQPNLARLAELR